MSRTTVKEETRGKFVVTFLDDNSTPVAPTSARWCLWNETTGADLAGWTNVVVPASGSVEITLPASYTRCTTSGDELLIIAVEAEPDTENQVSDEHELLVKNLRKSG